MKKQNLTAEERRERSLRGEYSFKKKEFLRVLRSSAVCFLALIACSSKERERAMRDLTSASAKQRAEGVRTLAKLKPSDDDAWSALLKSERDGAAPVRAETAAAMAATRRADAPDAIATLLRDPDDPVRIAAARALAQKCDERSGAYLRMAFAHSDGAVRAGIVDALQTCGVPPQDVLARAEAERRRKADEAVVNPIPALRARGAHELGLLGRDDDKKRLLALLDDRDGVVVASAARALGEARATEAAPLLSALLDEQGEVAAAAAEALAALGPAAVEPAKPQLAKLAALPSEEAVPAAIALGPSCDVALKAQNPQAAALLAQDCPAAPFASALATAKQHDALFEALLRAQRDAPGLDAALSKLLKSGDTDARIPLIAARYKVAGAALVDALRRAQAARAKELEEKRTKPADDGSAAEIAKNAPPPGTPNKERYARLMALLQERAGSEQTKASAAARLNSLLHPDPAADKRAFIAGALKAVLAESAPGATAIAAKFEQDPDPVLAAAARGQEPPKPAGIHIKSPPDPRAALWSDDGAARASACAGAPPEVRKLFAASDPERRVRDACAATNETSPRK